MKNMKTTTLNTGTYNSKYKISNLKLAKVNRQINQKHVQNFQNKLSDKGWMLPVICSSSGDVLEGHHKILAAIKLKQITVPAYIVNWVDTKKPIQHLNSIVSLNSGNLNWKIEDYLEKFALFNDDYTYVYNTYQENKGLISVNNCVKLFFKCNSYEQRINFREGKLKIIDKSFSNWLLGEITELSQEFGNSIIRAYQIRSLIDYSVKLKRNKKAISYLLKQIKNMAKVNHIGLSSSLPFQNLMKIYYKDYKKVKKN